LKVRLNPANARSSSHTMPKQPLRILPQPLWPCRSRSCGKTHRFTKHLIICFMHKFCCDAKFI
jgi:hypothetical protein